MTRIKISRSEGICSSRSIAIIRLDQEVTHYNGQPVTIRYYDEKGRVDAITAIGISDGIGRDCYRILCHRQPLLVRGVIDVLPDVTELYRYVENETFLFYGTIDSQPERWMTIKLGDNNERTYEDLNADEEQVYIDEEYGYVWFWHDGNLRREDDFLTKEEISALIDAALVDLWAEINRLSGEVIDLNTEVDEIKDEQEVQNTDISKLQEDVVNLELEVFPMTLEIVTSTSTDEINIAGIDKEITVNVKVFGRDNIELDDCIIRINDVEIIDGTLTSTYNETTELVITATHDQYNEVSESISLVFGYEFFCGRVNEGELPLSFDEINDLKSVVVSDNIYLNIEHTWNDLEEECLVFSWPSEFGKPKYIKHNGLNYYDDYDCVNKDGTTVQVSRNGIQYNIYTKKVATSMKEFTHFFSNGATSGVTTINITSTNDCSCDTIEQLSWLSIK